MEGASIAVFAIVIVLSSWLIREMARIAFGAVDCPKILRILAYGAFVAERAAANRELAGETGQALCAGGALLVVGKLASVARGAHLGSLASPVALFAIDAQVLGLAVLKEAGGACRAAGARSVVGRRLPLPSRAKRARVVVGVVSVAI